MVENWQPHKTWDVCALATCQLSAQWIDRLMLAG